MESQKSTGWNLVLMVVSFPSFAICIKTSFVNSNIHSDKQENKKEAKYGMGRIVSNSLAFYHEHWNQSFFNSLPLL